MRVWRDSRSATERDADAAYARARIAGRRLDAVLERGVREGKALSVLGKYKALTERGLKFNEDTVATLDKLTAKIEMAERKRDEAETKHHAYYDEIIKGVDQSVEVIDRLSNGPPLGEGGGS